MIKISRYFLLFSQLFLRSCPQVTFTASMIRYGFGSSLPACTVKHFRVHPNGDFSIYRYREAGRDFAMSLPQCHFGAQMRNNQQ